MKFEFKTENDHFFKQFYSVFIFFISISIIIIMSERIAKAKKTEKKDFEWSSS